MISKAQLLGFGVELEKIAASRYDMLKNLGHAGQGALYGTILGGLNGAWDGMRQPYVADPYSGQMYQARFGDRIANTAKGATRGALTGGVLGGLAGHTYGRLTSPKK